MWKNTIESDKPHLTIGRMRVGCWTAKATDNTLRIYNTYCFSTVTMVTRTCLNVTFICTLPVMFPAATVGAWFHCLQFTLQISGDNALHSRQFLSHFYFNNPHIQPSHYRPVTTHRLCWTDSTSEMTSVNTTSMIHMQHRATSRHDTLFKQAISLTTASSQQKHLLNWKKAPHTDIFPTGFNIFSFLKEESRQPNDITTLCVSPADSWTKHSFT
jgi:hypothetical protein